MARISVVIPTYGRPKFLGDAIASATAQRVDVSEIVVVDDASPIPVAVEHDLVRVIRCQRNGGPAAARNVGVANATGDVVAFLDDDDEWTDAHLAGGLAALERAPIAVSWQAPTGRILEGDVHDEILDDTAPNLGATLVRRDAWLELDDSYRACEDLKWWLDVTRCSHVATNATTGLLYRQHDGVRAGYGTRERIAYSERLLSERSEYFSTHPRARAFRWMRIGLMHAALSERAAARRAFLKSMAAKPSAAVVKHFGSTLR